jgi:NADH:ubiquinone oxidoreductase subunit F (NADH-binding)
MSSVALEPRLFAAGHGPLPDRPDLVPEVLASGLRGRGGGGFPAGAKLRAVAEARGRKYVVANGAESEPASRKDRILLETAPHLVLDGAIAAARAVGAREIVVAISDAAQAAGRVVLAAVEQRVERDVKISVAGVPEAFVAGEETALVRHLSGGPALPTVHPPRPSERGVFGRPTLVQNVETLAHVALIARYGASWFRSAGTQAEPGTALCTVSGAVAAPGVYEAELGAPLSSVLSLAGGATGPAGAVLVGGYHGGFVAPHLLDGVGFSERGLHDAGAALGARAIIVVPADRCGLATASRVVRYLAGQSAGQCGPCVNGLGAIADAFERLHAGDFGQQARIERWLGQVRGRGACLHPDGAARFVASALGTFGHEAVEHARRGCPEAARR